MLYGLRLLSATRAFGVDCRVNLIGLEEGGVMGEEKALVYTSFVLQWQGGRSVNVWRISALTAAKETGRGAPSVIAATCLAQASASSLSE